MRILPLVAIVATLSGVAPARAADQAPACTFGSGALPAQTLPAKAPHGDAIPIDNIVVLMQENRSFDHYLGKLRRKSGPPRRASNPDPTGGEPIRPFHDARYCEVADLDHSWTGTHAEWNGGAMDGFTARNVDPNDPKGARAMGYYTAEDMPFYYKLYRTFAMGDRYFSSVLSQTYPNRFYLLAGTSFGEIRNRTVEGTQIVTHAQRTIFNLFDEAVPPVSWKIYASQYFAGVPFTVEYLFAYVRGKVATNVFPIDQYYADAAAGALPQVAFVDPIFFDPNRNVENDEHPPNNVQVGQAFVARVIDALFKSPQWDRSALFLTYDEHGGFYDHVSPPPACVPDDVPPLLQPGDVDAAFDRYGIRVPAVVVSPYSKKRFVSHVVHDHTSVLRFIETRFDLPALTRRDANANPMLEFFDFKRPRFRKPPQLPAAVIDPTKAAECES